MYVHQRYLYALQHLICDYSVETPHKCCKRPRIRSCIPITQGTLVGCVLGFAQPPFIVEEITKQAEAAQATSPPANPGT